jgi:hypothetical protein
MEPILMVALATCRRKLIIPLHFTMQAQAAATVETGKMQGQIIRS